MLKIEEEMTIFNKLVTKLTITDRPKYNIGDFVFLKKDLFHFINEIDEEYLYGETKNSLRIDNGVITGIKKSFDAGLYYNEEDDQVCFITNYWDYTILLKDKIFSKNYQHTKVISNDPKSHFIVECSEGEIELISNIVEYVKKIDLDKIQSIKKEKLEKDEILAKRISRIHEDFLY